MGYSLTHTFVVQTVDDIGRHAKALYVLSTVGTRRDDRQHEREGYNLLVLSQNKMCQWNPDAHVWRSGDTDMSKLHPLISAFYNTDGWICINTYADGDGVVFKRPSPAVSVRGCGALARRKNFHWTVDMGKWLHRQTHNLGMKQVPFTQLVQDAEVLWGYEAPKLEHLQNKIKSREQAKKEGRPPPRWVLDAVGE